MASSFEEARASFIRTFKDTARYHHRYEVWRDFIVLAACCLHNGILKDDIREAEYMDVIGRYKPEDQQRFPTLLAEVVSMLDHSPRDVLGPLYMELEIGSKDRGQFFTPPELSDLMAHVTFGDQLATLESEPFITVQEPACGAGGMVLSLVKVLTDAGHNPAHKLYAQCIDVDRVAALMCFVQLSLWHVPAQIVVGNTLTLETREVWYTPSYRIYGWQGRLERHWQGQEGHTPPAPVAAPAEPHPPTERPEPVYEEHHIDWRGQALTVRFCGCWMGDEMAHLEIISPDQKPHPISETGYRSHFLNPIVFEEAGGPVAYTMSWLAAVDDGRPKQMSLFDDL